MTGIKLYFPPYFPVLWYINILHLPLYLGGSDTILRLDYLNVKTTDAIWDKAKDVHAVLYNFIWFKREVL